MRAEHFAQRRGIRQIGDAEVVAVRHVEADARARPARASARAGRARTAGRRNPAAPAYRRRRRRTSRPRAARACRKRLRAVALRIAARDSYSRPPGRDELAHALVAAERGLHRPLRQDVAAQAQRRQQLERVQILGGARACARRTPPSRRGSRRRGRPSTVPRASRTACRAPASPSARTRRRRTSSGRRSRR